MALEAHTRGIDGTIPIQAMLLDEEELWASQDNIGIYNGFVYLLPLLFLL